MKKNDSRPTANEALLRLALALLAALATSCSFNYSKAPDGSGSAPTTFKAGEVSYSMVRQAVLTPKCVGCHGTSGGVRLESYADVVSNLNGIRAEALDRGTMPKSPVGPLSDSEKNLLRAWIDGGAPEMVATAPGAPPAIVDEPLRPEFNSIREKVFVPKCLSCHSPGSDNPKASKIVIDQAEALTSDPDLVVPGKPEESGLLALLDPNAQKRMPPRRSTMAPLTQEELDAVRTWILNGAKP